MPRNASRLRRSAAAVLAASSRAVPPTPNGVDGCGGPGSSAPCVEAARRHEAFETRREQKKVRSESRPSFPLTPRIPLSTIRSIARGPISRGFSIRRATDGAPKVARLRQSGVIHSSPRGFRPRAFSLRTNVRRGISRRLAASVWLPRAALRASSIMRPSSPTIRALMSFALSELGEGS